MAAIDLKANPFFLRDQDIRWVEDTLAGMSLEEKVGQVFCPMGYASEEGALHHFVNELHVGGMMYRPGLKDEIRQTHARIQNMAKIPLLLAANTEAGGDGLCVEGTSFGKPMAVAATDDPKNAYRMGYTACAEGAAAGLNWSFAPIVDIDMEFHNPITNVRTFGSNPGRVLAMGLEYLRGAKDAGVAVSIKHFPGDGVDERDQHLVTSINSLPADTWMETYGHVYQELINAGAQTVMVGHIAQPAWVERLRPESTKAERLLPATLNKDIITGLLRGKLGFNGMISTDATPMLGFTSAMSREDAIPTVLNAGCDMILFNKSIEEDYGFLMAAVQSGRVSMERLEEAVTRILATKAALHLHEKQATGTLIPREQALEIVGCEKHRAWAKEVADQAVTLVKDTQNLLPISPEKYPRVYLNVVQRSTTPNTPVALRWKELFEKEGFEVVLRDRSTTIEPENFAGINMTPQKAALLDEIYRPVGAFKASTDLYVYVVDVENASNYTTARIDWNVVFGMGDDAPWFVGEKPALMISTCNPYHLFDAPMIRTLVNAYAETPVMDEAVMDKILGRSEFKGVSPVDPFCGKDYLR